MQANDEALEQAKLGFLARHLLQTAAPLETHFVLTEAQPLPDELLTAVEVGGSGPAQV